MSKYPIFSRIIKLSSNWFSGILRLLKIVVITNPLCGHCKSAHKMAEQLLELNNDNIQICIRFNVNTKDKESIAIKIALKILELYT